MLERNLSVALGLEVFMEFSFAAAGLAVAGAFSGGLPTHTPVLAQIYLVVGFVVTIAVIVRTWQVREAARRGELAGLKTQIDRLTLIAFFFSGFLPAIYLSEASKNL